MRSRGGMLHIGVAKTELAVLAGGKGGGRELLARAPLAAGDALPDSLVEALRALPGRKSGLRLPARVVLDNGLTRQWMVTPPANAARVADCHAAALARFHALYGEPTQGWRIAADWDARRPFLASAAPEAVLDALAVAVRELRLALVEVAPQFVVGWNRWRRQLAASAWFGVVQGNVMTVGVPEGDALGAVRELALAEDVVEDQQQLPTLLGREALRLNVPAPAELRLCGQIPKAWRTGVSGSLRLARLDQPYAAGELPPSRGISLALTGLQS